MVALHASGACGSTRTLSNTKRPAMRTQVQHVILPRMRVEESLLISDLRSGYPAGRCTPADIMARVMDRADGAEERHIGSAACRAIPRTPTHANSAIPRFPGFASACRAATSCSSSAMPMETHPDAVFPVTAEIIAGGSRPAATVGATNAPLSPLRRE
jgi:hypothetical protein